MTMIEQFKGKFRLTKDEQGDPIYVCKNGHVYEMGPTSLGLWLRTRRPKQTLSALKTQFPEITHTQNGDEESTYRYTLRGFELDLEFLAAVGAHRQRRLSPELQQAGAQRLAAFQFKPGTHSQHIPVSQDASEADAATTD